MTEIILDPKKLLKGYENSLQIHQQKFGLRSEYLKNLHAEKDKLSFKKKALLDSYLDPEIGLSKEDYLITKTEIENKEHEIITQVQQLEEELASVPTPEDLKTFEAFAEEIIEFFQGDIEPLPFEKRRILTLMNIKVWINPENGLIEITGFFLKDSAGRNLRIGLLDSSSSNYEIQPRQLPLLA